MSLLIPKIIIPTLPTPYSSRLRVVNELKQLARQHSLVLITAPAGYGKTTAVIDFVGEWFEPVCWYGLDELDSDISRFIAYMVASIQRQFPDFGQLVESMLGGIQTYTKEVVEQLVVAFVNDIYQHIDDSFVLVIDDYHFVDHERLINLFVSQLGQHIAHRCRLILLSRRLPNLPNLATMMARQQVGGFDREFLEFEAAEVQRLFEQGYGVQLEYGQAARYIEESEGWITGLLMGRANWVGGGGVGLIRRPLAGVDLYDYLSEIFASVPADMQLPMLFSSLLKLFDGAMCRQILDPVVAATAGEVEGIDWDDFITRLRQYNLFVQMVGQNEGQVRYHQLFQEYLQARALAMYPAEVAAVWQGVARFYEEQEGWAEAYALYERMDDYEGMVGIFHQVGLTLLNQNHHHQLGRWLDCLPERVVHQDVILLVIKSGIEYARGESKMVMDLLGQAETLFKEGEERVEWAQVYAFRATVGILLHQFEQVAADVERGLAMTAGEESRYRAMVKRAEGRWWQAQGNLAETLAAWREAERINETIGNEVGLAHLRTDMGALYERLGQYGLARQVYQKVEIYWKQQKNFDKSLLIRNNLGVLAHLSGDWAEAYRLLEGVVQGTRQIQEWGTEWLALASLGDLLFDLGGMRAAEAMYGQARAIVETRNILWGQRYLDRADIFMWGRQGRWEDVAERLSLFEAMPENGMWPDEWHHYWFVAGWAAMQQQEWERAAHCYEQVWSMGDVGERAVWLRGGLYLAYVYDRQGVGNKVVGLLTAVSEEAAKMGAYALFQPVAVDLGEWLSGWTEQVAGLVPIVAQMVLFQQKLGGYRRQVRQEGTLVTFDEPLLLMYGFGREEVVYRGVVAEWSTQVAQKMMFLVAQYPNGLSREQIETYLWPEGVSQSNYRKTVARSRQAIDGEHPFLIYDETGRYRLDESWDYQYDVALFKYHVELGMKLDDKTQKMTHLRLGVGYYKGAYLVDYDDEWAFQERQYLEKLYMTALETLAHDGVVRGAWEEALAYSEAMLLLDPYREEGYRIGMKSYMGMGERGEMARLYGRCKAVLAEGLGIEPSRRTRRLYEGFLAEG
ncbi:MAG TPA: BTAD domain-containing putative transcriptional regulator [Anaerolineae bacterium]|nr:BTAD domain-containing putative transcriptional regulator [Anaerolineae bacterium]